MFIYKYQRVITVSTLLGLIRHWQWIRMQAIYTGLNKEISTNRLYNYNTNSTVKFIQYKFQCKFILGRHNYIAKYVGLGSAYHIPLGCVAVPLFFAIKDFFGDGCLLPSYYGHPCGLSLPYLDVFRYLSVQGLPVLASYPCQPAITDNFN